MVHVQALPGTPNNKLSVKDIIATSIKEAAIYAHAGVDAIGIENMHDVPYLKNKVGHEVSTLMSIIGYEIKNKFQLPVGLQILAGANLEAMAASHSAGLDFIRAEGFVFGHLADEGYIDSNAGKLLRYRKQIGADDIAVFTDIKKKHSSHAITSDVSIQETAKAADFFNSDGLIISGAATGTVASTDELKAVGKVTNLPLLIGSGINLENIETYFSLADAFIVGSAFKKEGKWDHPIDETYVEQFMQKINSLKS